MFIWILNGVVVLAFIIGVVWRVSEAGNSKKRSVESLGHIQQSLNRGDITGALLKLSEVFSVATDIKIERGMMGITHFRIKAVRNTIEGQSLILNKLLVIIDEPKIKSIFSRLRVLLDSQKEILENKKLISIWTSTTDKALVDAFAGMDEEKRRLSVELDSVAHNPNRISRASFLS